MLHRLNNFAALQQRNHQINIQPHVQSQIQVLSCVVQPKNGIGGIFIGSIDAAMNVGQLKRNGITSVLSLCTETQVQYQQHNEINHLVLPIIDNEMSDLKSLFTQTTEFIQQAIESGNILVHCMVGVSRSASVIIAYLMRKWEITLEQALRHMIRVRPIVNPNPGFLGQLLQYEKQLFGQIRSKLTENLTIHYLIQNEPQFKSATSSPQNKDRRTTIINIDKQRLKTPVKVLEKGSPQIISMTSLKATSQMDSPQTIITSESYRKIYGSVEPFCLKSGPKETKQVAESGWRSGALSFKKK